MAEFGSLDPNDWREQEAQEGLKLQQEDAAAAAAKKRTWADTGRSILNAPYSLAKSIGSMANAPPSEEADQAAMMPETFANPLVKGLGSAVGSAVASGATAPGDALNNKIPQYGPEGHTSPQMIQRGFDTAAIAGGGSVAGSTEALPKLAADSAKAAAPLAVAEHAPPFYSTLEHAVAEHPQDVAPAKQWLGTLSNKPGVKPEEMKYTGTADMLAAKGDQPVTKAEIQDHLEKNKVQLGEVTKGAMPDWEHLTPEQQYAVSDIHHDNYAGDRRFAPQLRDWYDAIVDHSREGNETGLDHILGPAKFPEYQLPGATNYREKLLTYAPPGFADAEMARNVGHPVYQSSHWDEPNVLAHLRMNDRQVSSPGYVLKNTKSGNVSPSFETPEAANTYASQFPDHIFKNLRTMDASVPKKALHLEEVQSDWHQQGRQTAYGGDTLKPGWRMTPLETPGDFALYGPRDTGHPIAVGPQAHVMTQAQSFGGVVPGVPDAPFKKNWHELALKRALHEAAEGGYDRLSWTPGEAQASNPKVMAGNRPIPENMRENVDRADKGLQGFYNKIVPDYLNKVGKPHGASVKSGTTDTLGASPQAVHYMDITPSLRQHLLTKGMPLFEDSSPGAAVAVAGHAGEANAAGAKAGLDVGRGVGGTLSRAQRVEQAKATAERVAGTYQPLEGLPRGPYPVGGEPFVPGPNAAVHGVAQQYMKSTGRPYERADRFHPIDEAHATAIAKAYEDMPHAPDDPKVKASYKAMIDETKAQFQALKKSGLKIEAIKPGQPDPYAATPRGAAKDVAENNHLWYFPTESGFGSGDAAAATHPMLQKTGVKLGGRELLANDMFRIVHDYFGHLKEGNGFRAAGEDNAWRTHAKMYSEDARPAMTTETRGQNSWLNYGPHGEANRKASAADTHYAEQKVGIMPDWTMRDPEPMKALDRIGADPNTAPHPGAKYPQYAETYPPVGPPQLMDKVTMKPIAAKGKAAQKLVDQGKAYWGKQNTPEAQVFQKDRAAIQKEMDTKGYEPFFDPAERAHVDPANHPTPLDMTKDALPAKQATIDKYHAMFNTPEAHARLQKAFDVGKGINGADNWYAMRQLEDQYVKHLGPEEGRARFAREFAHTMAATTGGADPTSNLLLAHYVQWAAKNKGMIPEASYEHPFPIGGRYVSGNIDQFRKMPEGGFTENNPKRHDFGHAFLGHANKATMDEQMSGGLVPGMALPPGDSYGVAASVVHDLAAKNGVHPRDFQDVAWAGLKKMKTEEAGKKFSYKGPMITDVNDAIERTHRLTGMPRNEIVKRGLVKKEIPLYSGGNSRFHAAVVPMGSLSPDDDQ